MAGSAWVGAGSFAGSGGVWGRSPVNGNSFLISPLIFEIVAPLNPVARMVSAIVASGLLSIHSLAR